MRSSTKVAALIAGVGAAAVVGVALYRAELDEFVSSPTFRRRLAGASEYQEATQTIAETWEKSPVGFVLATVLVLILGSLAAGAGVGGGGLFVPIYLIALAGGNISSKAPVPLSKATILGGAIGNFVSIGRARHPNADRPLIDYEASTLMQSGELLGVVLGVLLNMMLPPIAVCVFLLIILSQNSYKTLKKAIATRKKETAAMKKAEEQAAKGTTTPESNDSSDVAEPAEVTPEVPQVPPAASADATYPKMDSPPEAKLPVDTTASTPEAKADLEAIKLEESKQFPFWAWALLIPMTIYTAAYALMKALVFNPCFEVYAMYWIWYVTPIPVLGAFMWYTGIVLKRKHARKVAAGWTYLETDMQWTTDFLKKFPSTAMMAGITAGLLGIGGGMVIGPLFLQIGMQAQVGTSSCAFMILFTAASGVFQYAVMGKLGPELGLWCVAWGFVSGQIGQRLVNKVIKKTGRPSYVIFLLGGIIGTACISMFALMVSGIIKDVDEKGPLSLIYGGSVINLADFQCQDMDLAGSMGSSQ